MKSASNKPKSKASKKSSSTAEGGDKLALILEMTSIQRNLEQLLREEREIGTFCFNKSFNAATDIDDQHHFAKQFDESEVRYDIIRNCLLNIRRLLADAGVIHITGESRGEDQGSFLGDIEVRGEHEHSWG